MKIFIPKIRTSEQPFFLGYGIYLFSAILRTSFYAVYFASVYQYIQLLCVCAAFIPELFLKSRYRRGTAAALLLFAALMGFVCLTATHYTDMVCMCVFVYCGRRVDFNKILRFSLAVSFAAVLLVTGSASLGIIQNYVRAGSRVRRYCGFRYALFGPAYVFNMTAIEVYLKKADLSWKWALFWAAANTWMFLETRSRLSFYSGIALLLAALFLKKHPAFWAKKKKLCLALVFSYVICFVIMLACSALYDPSIPWLRSLNALLGSRLALAKASLLTYGVSLFGQDITWYGWGLDVYGNTGSGLYLQYNYVDCLYIQVLQRYGICFLAVYLAVHTAVLDRARRDQDCYLMVILVLLAAHAAVDDLILGLHYNTFWFAIGPALLKPAGRAGEALRGPGRGP